MRFRPDPPGDFLGALAFGVDFAAGLDELDPEFDFDVDFDIGGVDSFLALFDVDGSATSSTFLFTADAFVLFLVDDRVLLEPDLVTFEAALLSSSTASFLFSDGEGGTLMPTAGSYANAEKSGRGRPLLLLLLSPLPLLPSLVSSDFPDVAERDDCVGISIVL